MNQKFILSCESTANLSHTYIDQKNIQILLCKNQRDSAVYYRDYFCSLLQQGDLLHIVHGARTASISALIMEAADAAQAEFPHRRLIIADSVSSAAGYRLLVEIAAELRDCGESLEAAGEWIENLRSRVHSHLWKSELSEAALGSAVSEMVDSLEGDLSYSGKCCISHSNAASQAEAVKMRVESTFPNLKGKVQISEISTPLYEQGSATGVALCYMG